MIRLSTGTLVYSGHTATRFRRGKPSMWMVWPPSSWLLDLPEPRPEPTARAVYYVGALSEAAGVKLLLDAIPYVKDGTIEF